MKRFVLFGAVFCLLQVMLFAGFAAAKPAYHEDKEALLGSGIHMGDRPGAEEWFQKGESLAETKKFDHAIEFYTKALEEDPAYADAQFKRGEAYLELKQYSLAIADYSRVVESNTAYIQGFFKRAVCFYYTQAYQNAIDDIDVVLSLQPQHGGAYLIQAVCFQKLGQQEQAIEVYRNLLSNVPVSQKEPIRIAKDMLKRLGAEADVRP